MLAGAPAGGSRPERDRAPESGVATLSKTTCLTQAFFKSGE